MSRSALLPDAPLLPRTCLLRNSPKVTYTYTNEAGDVARVHLRARPQVLFDSRQQTEPIESQEGNNPRLRRIRQGRQGAARGPLS